MKSIEDGAKLKGKLDVVCNGSVCFLSSENKKKDENAEIYNRLIRECKFDCRVLIATTVIYNGINIKDDAVKHIVLPFTSMSVTKQLLGRKRMTENETVKTYFPDITYDDAKRRYRDCIRDCMDLISLNQNLQYCALCQLNGLALRKNLCKFNNSDKKRYCERLEKQPLKFFTVYNKYRNLSSFFSSQSAGMERSGMGSD